MKENLLAEIFSRMIEEGFREGTEQYEICKRALKFYGFSYKRTEELGTEEVVDCSTLTSQSYWEGALIGIPFIAESQGKAHSGKQITLLSDMIPADVLIRYASLEDSPDKIWNHVGLYLGKDISGTQWLLESTSKTGVQLSTIDDFKPQGGIRRFTLTTEPFAGLSSSQSLALAPLVPKLGRLGARQYCKVRKDRPAHKGLDIYAPIGSPVYATIGGVVSAFHDLTEDATGVEIVGQDFTVRYMPLVGISIKDGDNVHPGDFLGHVIAPSERSEIQYSALAENFSHLHLEVETTFVHSDKPTGEVVIEEKVFLNHLYLSKVGRLLLPFHF